MFSEFRLTCAPQNALVVRSILASFLCVFALLHAVGSAATEVTIPAPREQPGDRSSTPGISAEPSPCQLRLGEIAVFRPSPPITGPGECTASDVVAVDAVLLPDTHRVAILPSVTLRCPMAEAVAHWIRDDVAPMIATLGASLRGVETLGSFDCRGRNGITGAMISEHGHANALDVRSVKLADDTAIELNDARVAKPLREKLRQSACGRFSTVLGNGADAYHESHVHLDLIERSHNYNICQWDVLNAAETAALAAKKAAASLYIPVMPSEVSDVPLPRPRPEGSTRGAEVNSAAPVTGDAMRAPSVFCCNAIEYFGRCRPAFTRQASGDRRTLDDRHRL
jgi:Extensin-like protein C-terminus